MSLSVKEISRTTKNQHEFNLKLFENVLENVINKQIEISNTELIDFVENNKKEVLDIASLISELNLFNSSVAHEVLTCVANDVGLSSKDYQTDLANGIECKHSYSLNKYFHKKNKKTYYRWYIRDIKNKIGEISFVGYHNGKTIRMAIPYEAYKNKKVISILTNENGIPIDGPYSKYYVKE